jgi:hypothetical protein
MGRKDRRFTDRGVGTGTPSADAVAKGAKVPAGERVDTLGWRIRCGGVTGLAPCLSVGGDGSEILTMSLGTGGEVGRDGTGSRFPSLLNFPMLIFFRKPHLLGLPAFTVPCPSSLTTAAGSRVKAAEAVLEIVPPLAVETESLKVVDELSHNDVVVSARCARRLGNDPKRCGP